MRQASIFAALMVGTLAASVMGVAQAAPAAQGGGAGFISATGGTVTNHIDADGISWIAHIFTTVGTNRFTVKSAGAVEYLAAAAVAGAMR